MGDGSKKCERVEKPPSKPEDEPSEPENEGKSLSRVLTVTDLKV